MRVCRLDRATTSPLRLTNSLARSPGLLKKRAGIRPVHPKDLRDTFASQLLTAGIPLAWISKQLGHGNAAVTSRHYATWIDAQDYRNPLQVREGELPCDLLARVDLARSITTPSRSITTK